MAVNYELADNGMMCISYLEPFERTDPVKSASKLDMDDQQILVNDREQLIYLLTEAA